MAFNMQGQQIPMKMKYESRYNSARANLLLVTILTLVNVVLLAVDASFYFPFSASFPYYLITGARMLCGMYPEEFYVELAELTGEPVMTEFFPSAVFYVALVIGVILIAVFSLCWLLSKKKVGWMIAALVLFIHDTLSLLSMGLAIDMLIDLLFHVWVLVSVISGLSAHFKLKSLPADEPFVVKVDEAPATDITVNDNGVASDNSEEEAKEEQKEEEEEKKDTEDNEQ